MILDKIDYGQGEMEICAGPEMLMIYEQEFDSDAIQDVYKKVVIRKESSDEEILAALDFRNVNWTVLLKILWASLKSADGHPDVNRKPTPSYKEWIKELGDINMFDLNGQLMPAFERHLFRSGAAATE